MGCLSCSGTAAVGALCRECAHAVTPCEGLIADHVRSTVRPPEIAAWLVDGFGVAHGIARRTTIGRSQQGGLIVLASSVSREHAEVSEADAGWQVRDLGSRNGTFVDGTRCQTSQPLPARSVLKVGDVAMWFLADVVHELHEPPSLATATAGGGLVRFAFAQSGIELCLIGTSDPTSGGALLVRPQGTVAWGERGLAPLEFQLLRTLCASALQQAESPASVRGCVATRQLARDLPFQSRYANEENVRQVVRRLRFVLAELGVEGLLAVIPGRGYYLAAAVTIAAIDRRDPR
ncbi:MAG: FHA domain-containing protein [Kofleriaceae bacterium]